MYKEKKQEIETKFNQTKAQLEQANLQAQNLAAELNRLQGEFRLISQLEKEEENKLKK